MNRSKIITATALATVMTAGAAHAELSISGLYAGSISDNPGAATSHDLSTNSIYVTYSDSMDNGMGVGLNMSVTSIGIKTTIGVDTGFGTIDLGNGGDSAVDDSDGNPADFSQPHGGTLGLTFADGDTTGEANSIKYSSPSMSGLTFQVTQGFDDGSYSGTTSVAAQYSLMGVSLKAGVSSLDFKKVNETTVDTDPSFFTAAYSIAGLNLGYAVYDNDVSTGDEETAMGVSTDLGGMTVGLRFAELDTSTVDTDFMNVTLKKSLGAMSFGVDYLETDASNAAATDQITFSYAVGF